MYKTEHSTICQFLQLALFHKSTFIHCGWPTYKIKWSLFCLNPIDLCKLTLLTANPQWAALKQIEDNNLLWSVSIFFVCAHWPRSGIRTPSFRTHLAPPPDWLSMGGRCRTRKVHFFSTISCPIFSSLQTNSANEKNKSYNENDPLDRFNKAFCEIDEDWAYVH